MVLLPEPLSPSIPITEPFGIVRFMSSKFPLHSSAEYENDIFES